MQCCKNLYLQHKAIAEDNAEKKFNLIAYKLKALDSEINISSAFTIAYYDFEFIKLAKSNIIINFNNEWKIFLISESNKWEEYCEKAYLKLVEH